MVISTQNGLAAPPWFRGDDSNGNIYAWFGGLQNRFGDRTFERAEVEPWSGNVIGANGSDDSGNAFIFNFSDGNSEGNSMGAVNYHSIGPGGEHYVYNNPVTIVNRNRE